MKASLEKAALEKKAAEIQKKVRNLELSTRYKKELSFLHGLEKYIAKHGYSKQEVIALLQIEQPANSRGTKAAAKSKRAPRRLKIFRNPITNETVETRGGNHRILRKWKTEHALENIDEWLVETRE